MNDSRHSLLAFPCLDGPLISTDLNRHLALKASSTDKLSIEANRVDREKTAPIGAVSSGSTLFAIEAS